MFISLVNVVHQLKNIQQTISQILARKTEMFQNETSISLYLDNVADIEKAIEIAKAANYNRLVTRITNPQLNQRTDVIGKSNQVFTRSDLLLGADQWRHDTILKVGEFGDCDSRDPNLQKASERNLKQELEWAKHLDSIAHLIVPLNSDDTCNLARNLLASFDQNGSVLVETPIVDKSFFKQNYAKQHNQRIELSVASTTIWRRWNKFRLAIEFNRNFMVSNRTNFF